MKKILLTTLFSFLSLPTIVHAIPQKTVNNTAVTMTIKRFQPVFCKSTEQITKNIINCYEATKITNPQINQYILMDISVSRMTMLADQQRAKQRKTLFSEAAPFLDPQAFIECIDLYMKPHFKGSKDIKTILNYYDPGVIKITKTMISQCQ